MSGIESKPVIAELPNTAKSTATTLRTIRIALGFTFMEAKLLVPVSI